MANLWSMTAIGESSFLGDLPQEYASPRNQLIATYFQPVSYYVSIVAFVIAA
jgi:hypothetical protein